MEDAEMQDFVVHHVASLQPFSPDIIRAVRAREALRGFARPLRGGRPDLHHLSYSTSRISNFWSHSWHGNKWLKALTALWLYNSLPATKVSTLGALVAAGLYALDILPGLDYWDAYEYPRSFWASAVGVVLYSATLFCWPAPQSIFLDVLCIDQRDPARKAAGIISMGAFLKCSESMLVLWDPTYTHRLWCIFELSAYLHAREGAKHHLVVRPVLLGPCYLLLTLALASATFAVGSIPEENKVVLWLTQAAILTIGFYPSVVSYRQYFTALEDLHRDLEGFTLQGTECECCKMDHVMNGQRMACDREVVMPCLTCWFGSAARFEQLVRSEVLHTLMHELSTEFFRYKRCIAPLIPVAWTYLDTASAEARKHWGTGKNFYTEITKELVRGAAWWLCVVPSILLVSLRLAYCLRARPSKPCCDWVINALILLGVVAMFVAAVQLEFACMLVHDTLPKGWEGRGLHLAMLLFASLCLPVAVLLFQCLHPRYNRSQVPSSPSVPSGSSAQCEETAAIQPVIQL